MLTLATVELGGKTCQKNLCCRWELMGAHVSHCNPCMTLRLFRNEAEAHSRVVQFCSDLRWP
jgi:hypothetical protein